MKSLNEILGIHPSLSTAYHPQTDGQTERLNQEVEQYLRLFVNHRQDDWVDWLATAQFSYNNRVQDSTGHSPFYLNYGLHPRVPTDTVRETPVANANEFAQMMANLHRSTRQALEQAAADMKKFADRHRKEAPTYHLGDRVLLDASHLRTVRPSKKLDLRRLGPFTISKIISPTAYELKLPTSWKVHPVFHVALLRPYQDGSKLRPPIQEPPPPEILGEELEYEVEEVLDSRRTSRGKLEYLVHWKGYPMEENSWIAVDDMKHSPRLINKFHKQHPQAIRTLSLFPLLVADTNSWAHRGRCALGGG